MNLFSVLGFQGASALTAAAPAAYVLDAGALFTLFFIMLGPLKLVGPYAQATAALGPAEGRRLAYKVAGLATVSVVLGGFLGAGLLGQWQITPDVLKLAAGLIFLLVALKSVMGQYAPARPAPPGEAAPAPRPAGLVFPLVLTPYGIAAVILLLSLSVDGSRTLLIVAIVLGVMLLNLLAMLYAHSIMRRLSLPLRVLGAVLGVLQVALAVQIMSAGLHGMGLI